MPRIKKESDKDKLAKHIGAVAEYRRKQANAKRVVHSVNHVESAEGKGLNMVTIADLISTARSGEILGYTTTMQVTNGGKTLTICFEEKIPSIPYTLTELI